MSTDLAGEESLEAEDTGCGLEGAENMGQEGDRGEAGLGDVVLVDTFTETLRHTHTEKENTPPQTSRCLLSPGGDASSTFRIQSENKQHDQSVLFKYI